MSLTTVVIANAVFVVALFAVLAFVLRIPFRLDRSQSAAAPVSIERTETEELAA
jgi:hypothetical protein